MKYKIVIEAIVDFGNYDVESLPVDCQPKGIADKLANVAISHSTIAADAANVLSVEPYDEEDDNEN
jgi:hypothetical protein